MSRGGTRPGAGRKRTGLYKSATLTVRISPIVKNELKRRAEELGKSVAQLIEDTFSPVIKG